MVYGCFLRKGNCTKLIGKKSKLSFIGAMAVVLLPLALFQSSTTQNDLMVAAFSVITIYLILRLVEEDSVLLTSMTGLAGGLSILTKISGASTLLPFAILFVVVGLRKSSIKKVAIKSLLAGSIGVLINLGFWIRNAIDMDGDFLALGQSYNWGGKTNFPMSTKLIYNIGWLFGNENEKWSYYISCLLNKLNEQFTGNSLELSILTADKSHDFYGYGIWAAIIMCTWVVALFASVRNKEYFVFGYAIACMFSIVISAACFPPSCSATRYLMGAFWATSFLMPWVLNFAQSRMKIKETPATIAVQSILIISMSIYGIYIQLSDYYMPYPAIRGGYSYEQLRTQPYYRLWDEPRDDFLRIIEDKGYDKIGLIDDVILGEYPILYNLREEKYSIQYINAPWGAQYEDITFIPDCIVVASKVGVPITEYEYKGARYLLISNSYDITYGTVTLLGREE